MMTTVMFSYDSLQKQMQNVTEKDILKDVLNWKKHWAGVKEVEIKRTIRSLLILGWIQPEISFSTDEDN